MTDDFESLGSVARAVAAVGLLFAAACGVGHVLVGRRPGGVLLSIAIGINLIGAMGVALGMAGLLAGSRSLWLLVVLAVLAIPAASRNLRRHHSPTHHSPTYSLWLAIPALLAGFITLGPALCYPTGWDELVYHHELPKRWLADGWPAFYADIPYSGFPSLGEILFWLVAPLEHVIAPRLIVWVCWALGIVSVYRLLRRRLAMMSAATLTAAFALSGTVLMISANCYVESILMLNVAALLTVIESRRRLGRLSPWRGAAISGILVGGAAAVKLTGLAIAVVPCIWFMSHAWGRFSKSTSRHRLSPTHPLSHSPPRPVVSLSLCLAVAATVSLPFYLRPWLLTGNPFYPYYAQWFSADPARLETSQYHHALGAAFGVRDFSSFFAAPVLLAFEIYSPDKRTTLYDGTFGWQAIGVLFLAVIAVEGAIRGRRMPGLVFRDAAIAGWLYVFWYFTAQQARFAIPAAIALLPVAAIGLHRFHRGKRQVVLVVLLLATLVSLPWRNAGHYAGSWMAAVALIRQADYVDVSTRDVSTVESAKQPLYAPLINAIDEHTPPDARLMVLFEHRGFYFPRRFEIGTPFFQEAGFTPPEDFSDPDRLMQRLRERQITHVIVTNALAGPDQVPEWFDRLEPFMPIFGECAKRGQLRVIWESERYVLLEVKK